MRTSSVRLQVLVSTAALFVAGMASPPVVQAQGSNCTSAPAGLVSWWRAEGNADDSAGTNNGTTPFGIAYAPGKVGQSFSFGASMSRVSIPDNDSFKLTNSLTIEGWINVAADAGFILFRGDNRPGLDPYALTMGPSGFIQFHIESLTDGLNLLAPITYHEWNHVAATLEGGSGDMKIYVNGVLAAQTNTAVRPFADLDPAYEPAVGIGNHGGTFHQFGFTGLIDEISLYSRALSAGEIQALYNAGSAGKCAAGIAGVPFIRSFAPAVGEPGTTVTIDGGNFSPIASSNIVYFGAVRAPVLTASAGTLTCAVPTGATFAPITVAVNGLVAWASRPFAPTFSGAGSNISTAGFASPFNLATSDGLGSAVIADLDGDGKPDLAAVTGPNHTTVSLFRNISTNGTLSGASFAPRVELPLPVSANPYRLRAADLDGDGRLDLMVCGVYGTNVWLFHNIATPGDLSTNSFEPPITLNAGNDCRFATAADLDADGRADIVALNFGDNTVSIFKNLGPSGSLTANSFAPPVNLPSPGGPYEVAIGDLDGDGKPDLALANYSAGAISLFRNVTTPGVLDTNSFAPRVDFPGQPHGHTIVIGDLDGDGKPDLVAGFVETQTISVYRNLSLPGGFDTNSLAAPVNFALPGWGHTVTLADFNGDGKLDIAVVGELPSYLSLFQNLSTPGSFDTNSLGPRIDFGTGWNAWGVAAGDLDGDGRPDVVFCNTYDWNIEVYQNILPFGPPGQTNPPTILNQPTNATVNAGGTAAFSVAAAGSEPLSYQWFFGSNPVPGATNASLFIANVQPSQAGSYYVVVTNDYGSVTSAPAVLGVRLPPPCVAPPAGLVSWWRAEGNVLDAWDSNNGFSGVRYGPGKVGQAFVNSCVVVPDAPSLRFTNALTVQAWVSAPSFAGSTPHTIVSKFDYSTFLPSVPGQSSFLLGTTNNGLPYFMVSRNGSPRTNSLVIGSQRLPVNQWSLVTATYDGTALRLYINGSLAAQTAYSSGIYPGSADLGIGGLPSTSPTGAYTWPFAGSIDEVCLFNRALSDGEILELYNTDITGMCQVPPTIVTQPQSQAIPLGEDVMFSVSVRGNRPLSYQWRFNGNNLPGSTQATLLLEKVQTNRVGSYSVLVSNPLGTAVSSNAVLSLLPRPDCVATPPGLISWWPFDGSGIDTMGTNNASASSPAIFSLGKVGLALGPGPISSVIAIPNSASLNFASNAAFAIEGWIKVLPANPPINAPTIPPALIYIVDKFPGAAEPGYGSGYALELQDGHLACELGALPSGRLPPLPRTSNYVQAVSAGPDLRDGMFHHVALTLDRSRTNGGNLYVDGQNVLTFDTTSLKGALSNTFSLTLGVQSSGSYPYNYPAYSGQVDEFALYSRALSASEILAIRQAGAAGKCKVLPFITVQPTNVVAVPGGRATFSVGAEGTPRLRYQWRLNGLNIAGATVSVFTQTNVQPSPILPRFSVLVSNAFGSVLSSNALLTVDRPPVARCTNAIVSAGPDCMANAFINNGSFDPDGDPITVVQTPAGPYPLGTNLITLTVTDSWGVSNSCAALVIVRDTTPPVVVCPANTVVEFDTAAGASVSFAPQASDNCSGNVPVNCTPPSGATFPIGSTLVTVGATDNAGNAGSCTFTVTVLGAQGVLSNVLVELSALRPGVTRRQDLDGLNAAIAHLTESLQPTLWIDQTHVARRNGEVVFNGAKAAVLELADLLNDKNSTIPKALLQGFIGRIIKAERLLAFVALQDAAAGGVTPKQLAQAQAELARGDEEIARSQYAAGLDHYRDAWKDALRLTIRLTAHVVNGRPSLEFAAFPGQICVIQTSTNLLDWVTVGTVTAGDDGVARFQDAKAASAAKAQFYRARIEQ